jgi:hypothetical protein
MKSQKKKNLLFLLRDQYKFPLSFSAKDSTSKYKKIIKANCAVEDQSCWSYFNPGWELVTRIGFYSVKLLYKGRKKITYKDEAICTHSAL